VHTANTERRDIVIDAIVERNDQLELITDNSDILTVSKTLFEQNFQNIHEVPLPLQANIMQHDGTVVEFITVQHDPE